MITNEGHNLIFIFSLPRSGSTLLSLILGGHSKIYCPPEPWFLLRLAEVYGEPASEKIFDDYYASLATKAFLNKSTFIRSARAFAVQAYNDCLRRENRLIFVDKTPRYYHILDFIDQLFPEAKKIWLKRNPLDVAASYKNSWNIDTEVLTGEKIDPIAFDFTLGLQSYTEYFSESSPQKFELKYEDILTSPRETISCLCEFCGIDFEEEMLEISRNKSLLETFGRSPVGDCKVLTKQSLDNSSIGRWRKELSRDETILLLKVIGGATLERMGYKEVGEIKEVGVSRKRPVFDASLKKEQFKRARFGVIYAEWQNYRQKVIQLENYIETTFQELQDQINFLKDYINVLKDYIKSLHASRYLNIGWSLGIAKKPAWIEDFLADQPTEPFRGGGGQGQETHMVLVLAHLLNKGFLPKIVLDIGAAKGYWSVQASGVFKEARFFLLEPLAEHEESLRSLCEDDDRFHYILTALGAEMGTKIMNISADGDGSTLLEHYGGSIGYSQREVPVTTIDKLIESDQIKPPDLVRIDVEGYEMKVLQGGQRMFDSAEVFIIETNLYRFMPECPLADEVIAYMKDKGYRLFDIAGLLRRPYENDLAQMDLVFVRSDSPLVASNRWR